MRVKVVTAFCSFSPLFKSHEFERERKQSFEPREFLSLSLGVSLCESWTPSEVCFFASAFAFLSVSLFRKKPTLLRLISLSLVRGNARYLISSSLTPPLLLSRQQQGYSRSARLLRRAVRVVTRAGTALTTPFGTDSRTTRV